VADDGTADDAASDDSAGRTRPREREDPDWPVHDEVATWETLFFEAGYDTVEQYRPRLHTTVRSLPAGAIEDGEDPAAGARRELREETGYVAGDLVHLDSYAPSAYERLIRHVYVARDLEPGERDLDDSEFLAVEIVPADEALGYVRAQDGPPFGGALTPVLLAREDGYP